MSKSAKLLPPTGYKGGKRKLSGGIADLMLSFHEARCYSDLCCGSGAVLLSLLERGVAPTSIFACEAGPWGMFWSSIADGSFDLDRLKDLFNDMPEPKDVAAWCEGHVAGLDISPEPFLVLQAASYGSTPVWHDGTRWRRGDPAANRVYKARGYWEPGPTSKETKPRGTIFRVDKIVERTELAMRHGKGMTVVHGRLEEADVPPGVSYLDPPYEGDTGYGFTLDVAAWIKTAKKPLIVSEGKALDGASEVIPQVSRRGSTVTKGSSRRPEFLNVFKVAL